MIALKTALLSIVAFACTTTLALVGFVRVSGLTARSRPGRMETWMAGHARMFAIAGRRGAPRAHLTAGRNLAAGAEQFESFCAMCHGANGAGETAINAHLYPPAPDLRARQTQRLSDAAVFTIIRDGVRFTGMPAWDLHDDQISDLVLFIRRLPHMSDSEIERLQGRHTNDHRTSTTASAR